MMIYNKIFKCIFLLFCFTQIISAQNDFEKANQLYRSEKFKEASTHYLLEIDRGLESAELYFNLANCYYKLNEIAPSIYYYEKALLLNPNDQEILINLTFAKNRTIDEIKDVPRVGFSKLLHSITSSFDFETWAIISIAFSMAFLLTFAGYYFSDSSLQKRIYFSSMFAFVVLMCISIASGFYEKSIFDKDNPAIIFSEKTSVFNEPKSMSNVVVDLHEGTKVLVLEKLDEWSKIELSDGTSGWIYSKDIKAIK